MNDTGWHWICTRVPPGFDRFQAIWASAAVACGRDHLVIWMQIPRNRAPRRFTQKKPNEINHWHPGADPVSVSVTPPLRSRWPNPLFYRVWCIGSRHPRRLPPQSDAELSMPQRSMILGKIAKTQ